MEPSANKNVCIAVDLTPLRIDGSNGGAKVMALRLIQQLADLASHYQFALLATHHNINELSKLSRHNIKIINIFSSSACKSNATDDDKISKRETQPIKTPKKIYSFLNYFPTLKKILRYTREQFKNYVVAKRIKRHINPDILFCPFTAVSFSALNIPIVSVIHDLQFMYYPYFFSDTERFERKVHFKKVCQKADSIICVSNHTKQTVLEKTPFQLKNLNTIYTRQAHRLPQVEKSQILSTLQFYNLTENNYLFYPANFWQHKNHRMLITAFNMYRHRNPHSALKLVCSGEDNYEKRFLIKAVQQMQLTNEIIFPEYLPDDTFSHLLYGSRAMIFPSLYEGFGMPILEAMAAEKPVLCSHVTSLPEIAESAALFFDPRDPEKIVEAIHRIASDDLLIEKLISLGRQRVDNLGSEMGMANEYLNAFNTLIHRGNI